MLTKQKGVIAEQAVALAALNRGYGVSTPIGDYLPYDLILDVDGNLFKLQVKSAWWDEKKGNYVVDNRRTRTNRREMRRANYTEQNFDYAVLYIPVLHVFYIMPSADFNSFGSEIHLVESTKRQRAPRSATFREAWYLLEN
ncbi:MAG: endonuclease [Saprospiraceae bacterium]|nr:endonuclease [Saprospiraceae bacterium]